MCTTTTAMATILRLFTIITLSLIAAAVSTVVAGGSHNITEILSEYPEYSVFNNYLTQTKLNDQINSRQTITVLVFNNNILTRIISNESLSVVKIVLSIHVLLDYFDSNKLENIGSGTVITTTLYQTTGDAIGGTGFVNITDFKIKNGGIKVGFGSVASGSKLQSEFIKLVKEIPYNISVVEIDLPIIPPGILTGGAPASVDLRSLLETAGCKTFAKLINDTGVLKIYETMAMKSLTVFAPSDDAFTAVGLPDLDKLTNAEFVSLLLFHASSDYIPDGSLTPARNPIETLASPVTETKSTTAGKYELNVEIESNNSVTIVTGIDSSRVENTALDSVPLSIYIIENVLLPAEIFAKSPSSVPSPAPEIPTPSSVHSPASSPVSPLPSSPISPSPSPISSSPSPAITPNRPTPSISSPIDAPAPAEIPAADDGNSNAGEGIEVPVMFVALVMMLISGIISSIGV